jgi:protein-S-isoprenylcysteine O-methyltransferase Ste14
VEGAAMFYTLRLSSLLIDIITFSTNPIHSEGIPIGLVGLVLFWYTLHHLGANITDTIMPRRNNRIVSTGPYRFIDHPLYLSTTLLLVARIVATRSYTICALSTIMLIALIVRTKKEEQILWQHHQRNIHNLKQNSSESQE